MKNSFLKIKELSPIHVSVDYLNWFRDNEIQKFILNKRYKNLDELKRYVDQVKKNKNQLLFGIFLKKNNKHIGNIKFNITSRKKNCATLGILIGDKSSRNKGYAYDIIKLSTEYIQKKYRINNFILGVSKKNLIAINAYKKNGFRIIKKTNKNFLMMLDLKLLNLNKFSLGTAQFGLNYGINNKTGKIEPSEIKRIIEYVENLGITNIDTAIAYGEAEKILGKIGIRKFKITSKLPYVEGEKIKDIEKMVKSSIKNLKIKKLNCLLIHSSKNIEKNTFLILNKMKKLKLNGLVSEIGISITKFHDIYKIVNNYNLDVIQLPYNIIDRRFESQKIINLLKKKKIKIQIRSIFLQGLLFKKYPEIPNFLKVHSSDLLRFQDFLSKSKSTKLSYMLNFVYRNQFPLNYIFGIDSLKQLKDIAKIKINNKLSFNGLKSSNENLINPSYWN